MRLDTGAQLSSPAEGVFVGADVGRACDRHFGENYIQELSDKAKEVRLLPLLLV